MGKATVTCDFPSCPFLSMSISDSLSHTPPPSDIDQQRKKPETRNYNPVLSSDHPRQLQPPSQLCFWRTQRLLTQEVPVWTVIKAKNSLS